MDLQRYAAVVGDANYVIAINRFLIEDLGWLPKAVAITDALYPEQLDGLAQKIVPLPSGIQPHVFFSTNTNDIRKLIAAYWHEQQGGFGKYANPLSPAFVIGSALDRELAKDIGAAHLSVSFPVANRAVIGRGYTGFSGGLYLIEDMVSTIIIGR
ncbi:hypothetical protein SDC9_195262 [bioreactor metagenome]|uniref:Nitrogenase/oxidoreductase component 1 domain-containing protein n=1 Tax=bioreactor metagenome TaxID=1076179 RepID=A0A645I8Q8_9ZZZZ